MKLILACMQALQKLDKNITILIYEPLVDVNSIFDCEVISSLEIFKQKSEIILGLPYSGAWLPKYGFVSAWRVSKCKDFIYMSYKISFDKVFKFSFWKTLFTFIEFIVPKIIEPYSIGL